MTALLWAARTGRFGNRATLVRPLCGCERPGYGGATALSAVAPKDHVGTARPPLEAKADPNLAADCERDRVHAAFGSVCGAGRQSAEALVDGGADLEHVDRERMALIQAVTLGDRQLAQPLVEAGANIDSVESTGRVRSCQRARRGQSRGGDTLGRRGRRRTVCEHLDGD
jgi:hypothetical protein